jgi:hypothetical protein
VAEARRQGFHDMDGSAQVIFVIAIIMIVTIAWRARRSGLREHEAFVRRSSSA